MAESYLSHLRGMESNGGQVRSYHAAEVLMTMIPNKGCPLVPPREEYVSRQTESASSRTQERLVAGTRYRGQLLTCHHVLWFPPMSIDQGVVAGVCLQQFELMANYLAGP